MMNATHITIYSTCNYDKKAKGKGNPKTENKNYKIMTVGLVSLWFEIG